MLGELNSVNLSFYNSAVRLGMVSGIPLPSLFQFLLRSCWNNQAGLRLACLLFDPEHASVEIKMAQAKASKGLL